MASTYTTRQLAEMLDTDPKTLRGYLRRHYKHDSGSTWRITNKMLLELREHFGVTTEMEIPEPPTVELMIEHGEIRKVSEEYPYGRGNQGPGTGPDGERLI